MKTLVCGEGGAEPEEEQRKRVSIGGVVPYGGLGVRD
jgi:hypothetical protein